MKKLIIRLIVILSIPISVFAQSAGENYVKTTVLKVKGKFNDVDVSSASSSEKNISYQYLDGLGRTVQKVMSKASPNGYDLVRFTKYDQYGQAPINYLPYVATSQNGQFQTDYATKQPAFYQGSTTNANDTKPFAEAVLDNSPMQEVLEMGAFGSDWQPSSGHTIKEIKRFNSSTDAVRIFDETGPIGYYSDETLLVSEITDENGNKTILFSDFSGKTILKKVQLDETIGGVMTNYLETYNVFDDYGRQIFQIPPKTMAKINGGSLWANTSIQDAIFKYVYNERGLPISKKSPDKAEVLICYDQLDRPILVQDANLRSGNKWLYKKFDQLGRSIEEGIYTYSDPGTTGSTPQQKLQNYLNAIDITSNSWYEVRAATSTGYSNQSFPTTGIAPWKVMYYDDYDFDRDGLADYDYVAQGITGEEATASSSYMLPTGSKSLLLGTTDWLINYVFYDLNKKPIQIRANNAKSLTVDNLKTVVYNFTGIVLYNRQYHNAGSGNVYTINNSFEYDGNDRMTKVFQRNIGVSDPGVDQLVAKYEYNELGQLIDKKLHGVGTDFLQSVDYTYTIRGWLKSINNSNLSASLESGILTPDLFGMEFLYNTTESGLNDQSGDKVYYNGKISALKWKIQPTGSASQNANAIKERSYKFDYDKTDRLKSAKYQAYSGSAWNAEVDGYNESMSYDHNGNILSMTRSTLASGASTPTVIDDLQYDYTNGFGNQIKAVSDATANTDGFNDRTSTSDEYGYDGNGNLLRDDNKGVTAIQYNELNKIAQMDYADGRKVKYAYNSLGIRIKKEIFLSGSSTPVNTIEYVGGFVYENGVLTYFSMPEGRVRNSGSALVYEYFIKDHLENVRVSFEAYDNGSSIEARMVQENHYYPFGLNITGMAIRIATPSSANRNLFNGGSELQDDYGIAESNYSTPSREYDPTLGRFNAIDPLADKFGSISLYAFALNDPIGLNDPQGADPTVDGIVTKDEDADPFGDSLKDYKDMFRAMGYQEDGIHPLPYVPAHLQFLQRFQEGPYQGMGIGHYEYVSVPHSYSDAQIYTYYKYHGELPPVEIELKARWVHDPDMEAAMIQKQAGYNYGTLGTVVGAENLVAATAENLIGNNLYWRTLGGAYKSTSLLKVGANGKYIMGYQGYNNSFKLATSAAAKFKYTGYALGGVSLVITGLQYGNNQISGKEAGVDAFFTVVGFIGPWGAGISAGYFIFKLSYEYFADEPLFDKPQPKSKIDDFIKDL